MLFQKCIQEIMFYGSIRFYLTNCNNDQNKDKVMRRCQKDKVLWLHLDSRFRGGNIAELRQIIEELRNSCRQRALEEIFPV